MEEHNPDGAGIGWTENGKVHWLKGLNAKEVDEWLDQLPRPLFIHFRWATAGGKRAELCHPFPLNPSVDLRVTGNSGALMMHNGHWSDWESYQKMVADDENPLPDGPWSDTRLAALLMARFPDQVGEVAKIMGGKVAIMNGKGKVRMFGSWSTLERYPGAFFSNTYWESRPRWVTMFDDTYYDNWKKGSTISHSSNPAWKPGYIWNSKTSTYEPPSYQPGYIWNKDTGKYEPPPDKAKTEDSCASCEDPQKFTGVRFDHTGSALELNRAVKEREFRSYEEYLEWVESWKATTAGVGPSRYDRPYYVPDVEDLNLDEEPTQPDGPMVHLTPYTTREKVYAKHSPRDDGEVENPYATQGGEEG